ncbi:hypothetical protein OEZ85_013455 [Tetradesmus obliquus]|uniref:Chitin-binding type-2 domain-containing protein n=1 Tax=Tetradesmus obliquus TaxID=3088 RepID=A0ABY8UR13_TETOB|nr:hypothetical protein OEZ85_013455 [Tetradesmus obliquus]
MEFDRGRAFADFIPPCQRHQEPTITYTTLRDTRSGDLACRPCGRPWKALKRQEHQMAARTAACVLFALFLFLLHATATEIEVVGGASRDLAQASAAAEPNNYHYSGGGVAAACYIWKVQPRTFNKYYCKAGLVCCPAKAHPFPKRNAGYGRYTLGVCAKTCETSPPPSSPPPSKGCRGNPTQPANGIFSCGDDKRAGDVCYATCDVNYVGIPSATCTSDLTWGPVQGACYLGVPPLEQGAPSEPAIIEFATGGSGGMGNSGGGGGMGGGGGGGKPNYKWVTLSDQASCQAACDAIPGTGWRYINGGSPGATWALCASVLDLGPPYGKQWVTGQSYWNQKECRLVDPKSKTSLAVNGSAALTKFCLTATFLFFRFFLAANLVLFLRG